MVESDQSSLLASCQPVEQVPKKWHGDARTPGNLTTDPLHGKARPAHRVGRTSVRLAPAKKLAKNNKHSTNCEVIEGTGWPSDWLSRIHCWNRACSMSLRNLRGAQLNMPRPAEAQLEKPEPELIVDARNGDLDAMTELFRRHYSHSVTVARRMLPAREEFLDAVQSAYLSAFRQFQSFRGEASFKTWITRIVLNQCLMHLRDPGQYRIVLSLDEIGPGGTLPLMAVDSLTPEDVAVRAELARAIANAVAKLPKPLNDVFTRCTVSGLSIRETAEALGLTVQATKTRLFRARSRLRRHLHAAFADVTVTPNIVFRS